MQADRHASFGGPSVRGRIVFLDGCGNRKIHQIAEAGLLEPAHDVNLVTQRHDGYLSALRRCGRCRAPDASIGLRLNRLRGYRQREEAESSGEQHEG